MAVKKVSSLESDDSATRRVADAAHDALDEVADRAEAVESRIRDTAEEAQKRLQENAKAARDRGESVAGNVQSLVREHPVASLGAAFLAGVVLSGLLRR